VEQIYSSSLLRKLNDEGIKDIIVSDNYSKEINGKIFGVRFFIHKLIKMIIYFLRKQWLDDIGAIII
jgi:hypothetical protein